MRKKEIIKRISEETNISGEHVSLVLNKLEETILKKLTSDNKKIYLDGFLSFELKTVLDREITNNKTRERTIIKGSKICYVTVSKSFQGKIEKREE